MVCTTANSAFQRSHDVRPTTRPSSLYCLELVWFLINLVYSAQSPQSQLTSNAEVCHERYRTRRVPAPHDLSMASLASPSPKTLFPQILQKLLQTSVSLVRYSTSMNWQGLVQGIAKARQRNGSCRFPGNSFEVERPALWIFLRKATSGKQTKEALTVTICTSFKETLLCLPKLLKTLWFYKSINVYK